MTSDRHMDWASFQRLDNASVMDFLTSSAGALAEHDVVSAKDIDNLRLVLSGVQSHSASRNGPVLIELVQQNAEFLQVLTARYGVSGFCLNLMRHTMRSMTTETSNILASWAQSLLKKAELLFNRPLFIYTSGTCERQTLCSTILIDFAEILAEACERLGDVRKKLSLMIPHDMAGGTEDDLEVDERVAAALGFDGLAGQYTATFREVMTKKLMSNTLLAVADSAMDLSTQLAPTNKPHGYAAILACDWLKAECQRLASLEIPRSGDMATWEVRRRNLAASLASVNEALKDVIASTTSLFANDQEGDFTAELPASAKRRVAFELMATGTPPAKATVAAEDLIRYLREKNLKPSQLLVGELEKINPHLAPHSLEILVKLSNDSRLSHVAAREKQHNLNRSKQLGGRLHGWLSASVSLLALLLLPLTIGCGLKGDVTSDVIEFRPDIPFRPSIDESFRDQQTPQTMDGAKSRRRPSKPSKDQRPADEVEKRHGSRPATQP